MTGFPLSGRGYPPLVLAADYARDTRFVRCAKDPRTVKEPHVTASVAGVLVIGAADGTAADPPPTPSRGIFPRRPESANHPDSTPAKAGTHIPKGLRCGGPKGDAHGDHVEVAAADRQPGGTRHAAPARAGGGGASEAVAGAAAALRRGHLGVVRGDDRRAERAARGHAQAPTAHQRADLDHQHRRVHVERLAAEQLGIISHRETVDRLRQDAHDARAAWSATRRAASTSTGTTTARGEADNLAADRRAAGCRTCPRSTTAGWRWGCEMVASRVPELQARAQRAVRLDGLRLLLPAGGQPDPVPLRTRHRRRRPAATTRSSRESRIAELHRDREGRDPASATTTARSGPSPSPATVSWVETRPVGFTRTYLGESVYEGAYPYNGTRVTP